jgi:hypothetical protein
LRGILGAIAFDGRPPSVAFALPAGGGLSTFQPPEANLQHDGQSDHAAAWRCAKGVLPKNGIGMAFWIAGVSGSADLVKVEAASVRAAGISRCGNFRCPKQRLSHWLQHEKDDEEAHSPIGDDERTCDHHRQHRVAWSQLIHHEMRDGRNQSLSSIN